MHDDAVRDGEECKVCWHDGVAQRPSKFRETRTAWAYTFESFVDLVSRDDMPRQLLLQVRWSLVVMVLGAFTASGRHI